ncbi:hypothetical protein [Kordiimonas marina]|uniref:hypothetical protein n=1 Tax=Kordiimonas marina TaxID=2872312 RepID=UPI001FF53BBA|nr:hypothetical protein [Kordiimonas marina]MCJ9428547.1 hypothetical protein [Kordiimonas marina]
MAKPTATTKFEIAVSGHFMGRWREEGEPIDLTEGQAKYQTHRLRPPGSVKKAEASVPKKARREKTGSEQQK